MGDVISSFLFQPPKPSRLKEDKIIWLRTVRGRRIPACYVRYSRTKSGAVSVHSCTASEAVRTSASTLGRHLPGVSSDVSSLHHRGSSAVGSPVNGGSVQRAWESSAAIGRSGSMTGRSGNAEVTILYSHANAEDLGNIYPWCKFLSKTLRVNVFAYDYTGYGLAANQGDPSEEDCYADVDAAFSYVRDVLGVPARNVVLYGRSLGSGPSCYLASRTADEAARSDARRRSGVDADDGTEETEAVGGVILHAPFSSIFRVVLETGCTLPGDRFPNVDFAPSIR